MFPVFIPNRVFLTENSTYLLYLQHKDKLNLLMKSEKRKTINNDISKITKTT